MRWRLSKLNWAYGIGELFIVVVGVMIALGFEQWNSDRLDRVEEVEIIERLIADLTIDLGSTRASFNATTEKAKLLERIYSILESSAGRPEDLSSVLADVAASSQYGWNQREARRTTIDEVLASGKFGLIRETSIRVAIADYYDWENTAVTRREERETGYSALTYRLVPRAGEFEPATDLSEAQIERFVSQLFDPSTRDAVVAETNFTRFVDDLTHSWQERCVELIGELEAYRDTIQ